MPSIDFNDTTVITATGQRGITYYAYSHDIRSWSMIDGELYVAEFYTTGSYDTMLPIVGYSYYMTVTHQGVGTGELNIYNNDGSPVVSWSWVQGADVESTAAAIIAKPKEWVNGAAYDISYNSLISGYYSSLGARVVNANDSSIVYGTGTIDNPTSTVDVTFIVQGMNIQIGTRVKLQIFGTKKTGSSLGEGLFESDAIEVIQ